MVNLSLVLKHISSHNPQEKKYNNGKDLNFTKKLQSVIATVIIIIAITAFFTWYILRWGTNASFIHENPMKAVKVTISLSYRWGNRGAESLVWRNWTKNVTLSGSSIKLLFFSQFSHINIFPFVATLLCMWWVCIGANVLWHMCGHSRTIVGSQLFPSTNGSRDWTQAVSLGSK